MTAPLRLGVFTAGLVAGNAAALGAAAVSGHAAAAGTVWFLGWFPLTEGLIAAGTGAALGVPPTLNVAAAVLGNLLVLPLVYGLGLWLNRFRWMRALRTRAEGSIPRLRRHLDRWGGPAVAALTPWLGAWATAVALDALGASRSLRLVWPAVGILAQVALLQGLILAGVAAAG